MTELPYPNFSRDELTIGEIYGYAMTITDQDQADKFFNDLVSYMMRRWSLTLAKAESISRSNIGYYTGYCGDETARRVMHLFKTVHPLFGSVPEPANNHLPHTFLINDMPYEPPTRAIAIRLICFALVYGVCGALIYHFVIPDAVKTAGTMNAWLISAFAAGMAMHWSDDFAWWLVDKHPKISSLKSQMQAAQWLLERHGIKLEYFSNGSGDGARILQPTVERIVNEDNPQ